MSKSEFKLRRKKLMSAMGRNAIAIIPTAQTRSRNRDVDYPFRPDSDFYYLTGFDEPEAIAVLVPGRRAAEYILFCREKDPLLELWDGPRAGQEGACLAFGADDSFPISDLPEILPGLMEGRERVFYTMGNNLDLDHQVISWVNQIKQQSRAGVKSPSEFVSTDEILHEMRLFKGKAEVACMRKAADISAEAHCRAMRMCKPGMMEYAVEAELLYEFNRNGVVPAYPSIVGGGNNACVLHYIENNTALKDGDLLLIDAGAEYQCYPADITRTFPVNGKFTKEQKAVYEIVLDAQKAAIDKIQPGRNWNEPHDAAVQVITRGLIKLGLLKGKPKDLIKNEAYKRFYMHRTGHWLGMDVHDVGHYKTDGKWRKFEPGMTLTVEPGIYIPAGSKGVAKKWWNIGVRIEDDVLVNKNGAEVLTAAVPKQVDEIESLMGSQSVG